MASPDKQSALDHIVVVMLENRSLDSFLGHLYGFDDDKTFEEVIGTDLSTRSLTGPSMVVTSMDRTKVRTPPSPQKKIMTVLRRALALFVPLLALTAQ